VSLTYPFVTTHPGQPAQVVFQADWLESEKGNTMLTREDGALVVWIHIAGDVYLEITDTPGNNPRFYATFIEETKKGLIKHIKQDLQGWYVQRWNLSEKAPVDKHGCVK